MQGKALSERHVPLEGCLNLRDLGGYPTVDGREVRRGCVYRSSELCSLTDADITTVASLGLVTVVDLRGDTERTARPNRLPPGVDVHERTSASTRSRPTETIEDQIASGTLPERDDDYLTEVYIGHLESRLAPELRRILELAVDAPARPLLFHCAAGKDRTGVAAAVLLGALGVPDDVIVADYELTGIHWAAPRLAALAGLMAEHGVTEEQVRPFLEPRTDVFRRALRHLHERWGGFEGYAVDHLGVDPGLPTQLRSALTG